MQSLLFYFKASVDMPSRANTVYLLILVRKHSTSPCLLRELSHMLAIGNYVFSLFYLFCTLLLLFSGIVFLFLLLLRFCRVRALW